jgi:Transposase DDE domain group 1
VGETQNQPFQLSFNPSLKVDFRGSRVTSDSGLLLMRELDERLGLNQLIEKHLTDGRRGKNTQLPLPDLLRQSLYSRLAGYEDVNDAERLSQDPTFRLIGSAKIWERRAALSSRLHWFETEVLAQDENLDGLSRINRELLAKAELTDLPQRVVLDMDSTEIPVYGDQEHSAYNGHFESTCYHPLLRFNSEGDGLAAKLRPASGERQPAARHRGTADAPGRTAQSETGGVVQGLSLSSRQLENTTTGGGEGRVPCRGVIPASGLYRNQSGDAESGGGALLQQAGNSGAVDQRRQAGGPDDATLLSPFSF